MKFWRYVICTKNIVFLLCLFSVSSCHKPVSTLFKQIGANESGINFQNTITETEQLNIVTYQYMYNGGGVAAGDINNDGLVDLYFTGNQAGNALYLNKGNFIFSDITQPAKLNGHKGWKTGATMADINGDGWLDIYVCYSGPGISADRANQLFINNGCKNGQLPTFTESAKKYGLDAPGTFSTQAAFFDYDNDGDLDMFLLDHSNTLYSPFFNTARLRTTRHPFYGNKLFENENGHFCDVSEKAGIDGSGVNYGLGISISDINNDGYQDIYVTNDFEEQDFLYLNNKNGTFSAVSKQAFGHLSKYAMGVDIADYNNDSRPDIVTLDMLPEDNHRQKLLKGPDEYDKYQLAINSGYQKQQMRNMLQLNQGINLNGIPIFSEIGQLAGISNTDWSWAPLMADYDNDGLKDLFITNGFLRDFTNLDFLKYDFAAASGASNKANKGIFAPDGSVANRKLLYELVNKMPSTKIHNYIFKNNGDLTFSNKINDWGFATPTVSSGAAYADLDNDGDLDLVINNINEPAGIFKNNAREATGNHFLGIKLTGNGKNTFAIGAKVYLTAGGITQFLEQSPTRGFQSSVDYTLHFGIGQNLSVSGLKIVFADGGIKYLKNVKADQLITLDESHLSKPVGITNDSRFPKLFEDITSYSGIDFDQHENDFVDFNQQFLIPDQPSRQGPKMAKGDVNNDGLEDVFMGAPSGQWGILYIQQSNGAFRAAKSQPWKADAGCEDVGSVFFDADGDGDADLYVVSGGSEFKIGSPELQDRLYLNDGTGIFKKAPPGTLPQEFASGSCVTAADYDHDGKVDLYVGGRIYPGNYPQSSPGGILRNITDRKTGIVKFVVATPLVNAGLRQPGMVTDAKWADLDNDGWAELIVAGQWMPLMVFKNCKGKLVNVTQPAGLGQSAGLWNCITVADMDHDGQKDIIAGNLGTNTQWRASGTQPLMLYGMDIDNDGKYAPVICNYIGGKSYPIASRDEMVGQFPFLNKKYLKYAAYADAQIEDIFTKEQITRAKVLKVNTLKTSYVKNLGHLRFRISPLPVSAQFSPVQSIITGDFNTDGVSDLLLTGNYYPFRVQYGPCDASLGLVLQGKPEGGFLPLFAPQSGLYITGDVRDAVLLNSGRGKVLAVAKNDAKAQVIKIRQQIPRR